MKLVICEKQIAAHRIASILSDGKLSTRKFGNVPYYTFENNGEEWIVLGLKGHIVNLDYPPEYNRWYGIKPIDLIWIEPYKKITDRFIVKALENFSKYTPQIIIATDFDREGELIGVEAIEILKKANSNIKNIKRAKFSALTKLDILNAFSNLADVDHNLATAAETRQIIDLVWGATLTRFISMAARQYGKDFLSVGRVQSPTLAIIAEREKKIKNFVPTPYWQIIAKLSKNVEFLSIHEKGRIEKEQEAKDIFDRVKDEVEAKVESLEKKIKKERPPTPFDTTTFLKVVSSSFGVSASRAMEIAEGLYMKGMISYPRTDNTVYPKTTPINRILNLLASSPFSREVDTVLKNRRKIPTRGKKKTSDHPPIHPVGVSSFNKLTKEQQKVYTIVVRRFLATLTKDAIAETSKAKFRIGGEPFISEGYRTVEPTWKTIYPVDEKQKPLPDLTKGESIKVISIDMPRKETKPPKRYTQGSIISEMEKLGLGTKSTRHEIIRKLYGRKYLVGAKPVPTASAFAVVDTIGPYSISKPDMTSRLEKDMDLIADGNKNKEDVIKESRDMLKKVLSSLERDKQEIRKKLTNALKEQRTIGKCPSCGKSLVIRRSKNGKRFVGCSGYPKCKVTYPLPQKGKITPTGKVCPECGAPILRIGRRELCINPKCSHYGDSYKVTDKQ